MYGDYLTAKVRAKRENEGVDRVILSEEADDKLRVDPRTIHKETASDAPVRWGMSGDFAVTVSPESGCSKVVASDGTIHSF